MNINMLTEKKNSQEGDTVNISERTNCSVGSESLGLSSNLFEGILKQAYANFKFLLQTETIRGNTAKEIDKVDEYLKKYADYV